MPCAESLRLQAYFDAEVDAMAALEIERHLEHCAECRDLLQHLQEVRAVLRRASRYVRAPPALRAKIMRSLDADSTAVFWPRRPRSFWAGTFSGVGGTALAAIVAWFFLAPRVASPLLDELVNAHLRSLLPAHLIDVESADKHTVKPWLAGHADVSPVVADFESQGYRLIGGRADYLEHRRAAVIVYQHGSHIINVFSWASTGRALPQESIRDGYRAACWKTADLEYCAVSDTAKDELSGLVRLLQERSARDSRE